MSLSSETTPSSGSKANKTGIPTVVLIDGKGYKPSALKWLKEQVSKGGALIGVWDMMEFQTRVNNGFLG